MYIDSEPTGFMSNTFSRELLGTLSLVNPMLSIFGFNFFLS